MTPPLTAKPDSPALERWQWVKDQQRKHRALNQIRRAQLQIAWRSLGSTLLCLLTLRVKRAGHHHRAFKRAAHEAYEAAGSMREIVRRVVETREERA